jgi:hypothetical protein
MNSYFDPGHDRDNCWCKPVIVSHVIGLDPERDSFYRRWKESEGPEPEVPGFVYEPSLSEDR